MMILGVLGVAAVTGVVRGRIPDSASGAPRKVPAREPNLTPLQSAYCPLCGTVESIRTLELRIVPEEAGVEVSGTAARKPSGPEKASTTPLGTVAEAVTGGAGEGERNLNKRFAYRITVRMDDGSYRTVSQSSPPALAVGDKVRVVEGRLVRT